MPRSELRQILISALAIAAIMAGCATPRSARELAAQGAVVTDGAQTELRAFIDRAEQAYRRREAILRELAEGEIRDTASGDFRSWVAAEAGANRNDARIALIRRIADRSRQSREAAEVALAAKAQQIAAAASAPAVVPAERLADTRRAFLHLAQELTPQEWLRFSQQYVAELRTELKALKAEAAPAPAASAPD